MRLQVLAAAVDKEVNTLAQEMHLETEAIIVNQCDSCGYQQYLHNGRMIRCFSMKERGVGLSRNTALMHAEGEICLFSDEDIAFYPGYEEVVLEAFDRNPDADVITFNFKVDSSRATYHNEGEKRIRWYNYGRYPTYAVAARLESLRRANVSFSLLFGGGARYSNGEDSLFLHDCLKSGLHLYGSAAEIGEEIYRESTWFKGYNQKFFFDRGVLYHHLYGFGAGIFALRFLLVHGFVRGGAQRSGQEDGSDPNGSSGEKAPVRMFGQLSFGQACRLMRQGIREGRRVRAFLYARKSGKK